MKVEKKEYIERGALSKFVRDVRKRLPKDSKDFFTRDEMLLNFQQYVDAQPAADVEPVGNRTTFDEEAALEIGNFIDMCEVDAEAMDGFVQDRFKTYLHALVYESVSAHMKRSGSGE